MNETMPLPGVSSPGTVARTNRPIATAQADKPASDSGFVSRADFIDRLTKHCKDRPYCRGKVANAAQFAKDANEVYDRLHAAINGKAPPDKAVTDAKVLVPGKAGAQIVLQKLSEYFGLEKLSKPGGRAFWSGPQGKKRAINQQKYIDTKFTALEGSDIGSFFDTMNLGPFQLSGILWSEISTEFAKGAQGDIVMYATEGVACHKVFWNDEVEEMRKRQRQGTVRNITIFVSAPTDEHDIRHQFASHPDVHGTCESWVPLCQLLPHRDCTGLRIMFDGAIDRKGIRYEMDGHEWFAPLKLSEVQNNERSYDPHKLYRFVDFLLGDARGDYAKSLGFLYGYGRQVLRGVYTKFKILSAMERAIGGVKVLLADYYDFYLKEIFIPETTAHEFTRGRASQQRRDLDTYLEDNIANFADLPRRMAVVGDAILSEGTKAAGGATIEAIRVRPDGLFVNRIKDKRLTIPPTRLPDFAKLERRIGKIDFLYQEPHLKAKAIEEAVALLREGAQPRRK